MRIPKRRKPVERLAFFFLFKLFAATYILIRKFLIKSLVAVLSLYAIYLITIFTYPSIFSNKNRIQLINNNDIIKSDIIISGDSRAEFQIDPALLNQYTHKNCINVAESALDLFSLTERLKLSNLTNKTFVISSSFWQINDGSIDKGYIREEALSKLSFKEKISLYKTRLTDIIEAQNTLFLHRFLNTDTIVLGNKDKKLNQGYGIYPCKTVDLSEDHFKKHPWYLNPKIDGVKLTLLKRALLNMKNMPSNNFVLYNGVVCPGFKTATQKNGIWNLEKKYNDKVFEIIKAEKITNVHFFNLIENTNFETSDFTDIQHTCIHGNVKFTKLIAQILQNHSNN
jgi:hypothetical protein